MSDNLPSCCEGGIWTTRDPVRRQRELNKRGFSSLPKMAVCSKCGRVILFDAGIPDEDYQRRKKFRNRNYKDDK